MVTLTQNQKRYKVELPPPTKCKRCGKTEQRFSTRKNQWGKRYYQLTCNTCRDNIRRSQRRAKLRAMDPKEAYRIKRNEQLRNHYKISLIEYEELLAKQNGVCAICGLGDDSVRALHVDHCHTTKRNRAILCHKCNKGLGQFMDNPENLRRAANYLEKWGKTHAISV